MSSGAFYGSLRRCRMCWRVTAAVFAAVLAVEAAILVYSTIEFRGQTQRQLAADSRVMADALHKEHVSSGAHGFAAGLRGVLGENGLVGGILYDGGKEVSRFGEAAVLLNGTIDAPGTLSSSGSRVETVWAPPSGEGTRRAVLRLDASRISAMVTDYMLRILGLILLVALFVTVVSMLFLSAKVLHPLLGLRDRLALAGEYGAADMDKLDDGRPDELGDVFRAFDEMAARLHDHRGADLAVAQELEAQVEERTEELTRLNLTLQDEMRERHRAEEESRQLAKFPAESPDPVLRVGIDGEILYGNPASQALLDQWECQVGGSIPPVWQDVVADAQRQGAHVEREETAGEKAYVLVFQPVLEAGYINIYGRDVSARKNAEERLAQETNEDELTGLPNRTLFLDRLEQSLRRAKREKGLTAVHMIDIDHFKDVNDTLGHAVGDALLKQAAGRLLECCRDSDTVARLGGDEFAVIQIGTQDTDGIAVLAQKIIRSLSEPFNVQGHNIHTNGSIGVTVFPDDAVEADQVMRNADMALHRAKSEGRGIYRFFISDMNEEIQRTKEIQDDMRLALEREEFVLYYQPKLDLKTGRVLGMEALIRWQHPQQGFLPPGEFIPVAEKTKLILPIGEWALWRACTDNQTWQDQGLSPMKVAVNLSAMQFTEEKLPASIAHLLEKTGLDPRWLELEITESAAMDNAEKAIVMFDRLSALGLSLSIDDFGTGYSSLSYLRSFPVKRVKIDKAFVDDIGTEKNTGAIARAVTTLGHSFGMEVTAEGVEEESQLEFLRELGCDEIQGYFFARPLPAAEFEAFVIKVNGAPGKKAGTG